MAFKMKLPISRDSYISIADSISLDSCETRHKLADKMFIYDLISYNIDSLKLLFLVGLHVPVHFTRTSSLFLCLNIKLI